MYYMWLCGWVCIVLNYSFDSLNDKEFEELVNDLLTKELNQTVIRYAPGRDLGIDGKVNGIHGDIIVQSKHYLKSTYSQLKASLKKEKAKVEKLDPVRYIIATSKNLTPPNVKEIVKILDPYVTESDVLFNSSLNDLLKKHPEVERNHYKLWLTSTTVLEHLINNGVYNRSRFTLDAARRKFKLYTQTSSHLIAKSRLKLQKCIIITGEPGVGKTTLAEQVCNEFVANGYHFFDIGGDIKSAFEVYREEVKQIFYYDDFLGSNYLEAFENNQDSEIVKFINEVTAREDNHKFFIFTSRASIFAQGLKKSDKFYQSNIDSNKLLLNITNLSMFEKASMLYNHIYHSNLSEEYHNVFYEDDLYLKIIKHKNFNPRLIEFITSNNRISHISPHDYSEHILQMLDNPADVWKHAFTEQLKEIERVIIYFVAFSASRLDNVQLFNFVVLYLNKSKRQLIDEDFNKALTTVVGSFILSEVSPKLVTYRLFNPSIKDYLINKLEDKVDTLVSINIFEVLNQPGTIEVSLPISKFQRLISKRIIEKSHELCISRNKELLIRCSTNVINSGVGISEVLCMDIFNSIKDENNRNLDYSRLVIINRILDKYISKVDTDFIFKLFDTRTVEPLTEYILVQLSLILRHLKQVKNNYQHLSETYLAKLQLEMSIDIDLDGEIDNQDENRYRDFKNKYNRFSRLFQDRALKFWHDNYKSFANKLINEGGSRSISSSMSDQIEDILTSYEVISENDINELIDGFDFENIQDKELERKINNSQKSKFRMVESEEVVKIRMLFVAT
jgi:adenylate kinase family enzyme